MDLQEIIAGYQSELCRLLPNEEVSVVDDIEMKMILIRINDEYAWFNIEIVTPEEVVQWYYDKIEWKESNGR